MNSQLNKSRALQWWSKGENKVKLFRMALFLANVMMFIGVLIFIWLFFKEKGMV